MKKLLKIYLTTIFLTLSIQNITYSAGENYPLLKQDWSFKSFFGTFDRASLQRGYQVYTEVCASCHSLKYVSYRNLAEKGGPEFSIEQAKAIASNFDVTDGPNYDGEMFTRQAK